jgi:ornithine cyclodeaminase/alanine dehydrogenase-like protein (mu-crystallin family)
MQGDGTLLLRRTDVAELLTLEECIDAVEEVFRLQGEGKVPPSGILGVKTPRGGLHIKAGFLPGDKSYVVAKANTNFPGNGQQFGLPTIQGVIIVCDAENGQPLAVLDSIDVTIKRTAAASAVAAKHLARPNSNIATICGCGRQGRAQLRAVHAVRPLKRIFAFDLDERVTKDFVNDLAAELKLEIEVARDLRRAIWESDICVTCTPSRKFFVRKEDVPSGCFIAAVGADDEHKQEIDPALLASCKVVADSLEQCSTIGDLHHAISGGLMRRENVFAELAEVVAGRKPGRTSDDEVIVFDSTGVAIEDAVTAATVYEKARAANLGTYFNFAAT